MSTALNTNTNSNSNDIEANLKNGIEYVKKRHKNTGNFIVYFQKDSNTNKPADELRQIFFRAIDHPDIVGLSIATRPDCIDDFNIELLKDLSKQTMLIVEMGLQTANDQHLKQLNRGHTVLDFEKTAKKLLSNDIHVCAHVIIGLPDESEKEILNTATFLNRIRISGVKIHNLHILKSTVMEKWYNEGKIKLLDLNTYAKLTVDFIEHLNSSIIIHRVNGHAPKHITVAPEWSINKLAILNAVNKEFARRDTWQGKKLETQ